MNYYITDVHWRSNGEGRWGRSALGDGGGPPRAALLGGGKIEGIAKKNWEGEKHVGGGEILGRAFK